MADCKDWDKNDRSENVEISYDSSESISHESESLNKSLNKKNNQTNNYTVIQAQTITGKGDEKK